MNHGGLTQQLVAEVETRGNIQPNSVEGVDFAAMRVEAAQIAGSLVLTDKDNPRPGQVAQALSPWQRELAATCSRKYRSLTAGPEGRMSRIQANQDPELLALQALRRGVRDAMRKNYRQAGSSLHASRHAR